MPIEDIAKQINRTVGPVQKFIDKENFCIDTYLQGNPDDKESDCYKKITDEKYSEITKNYVDMSEYFRVFLSIAQEIGGF